jgi:hypothetical protein
MLTKDECFYALKNKCTVTNELYDFSLNHKDWYTQTKNDKYSFLQCKVPDSIAERDIVLNAFLKLNKRASIYLVPSWVYYTMHEDTYRTCAINLSLSNYDSTTFFNVGRFRRNQIHIHELKYEQDTYYAFNTKVRHAVLNKDKDRYVVSIGITDMSYQGLINKIINDKL